MKRTSSRLAILFAPVAMLCASALHIISSEPEASSAAGPEAAPAAIDPEGSILDRFGLSFSVKGGVTYDDNIFLSPSNEEEDFIYFISPAIAFGLGDVEFREGNYLAFDYAPRFLFFQDNGSEDTVEHGGAFSTRWSKSKLTLGADADLDISSGGDAEVGGRTERTLFTGRLTAAYELTGKITVEAAPEILIRNFENNIDSTEVAADLWLDYQAFSKVTLGLGARPGILDVEGGEDQEFLQTLLRANYAASEKFTLTVKGGVDFRQYDSPGVDDSQAPVFGLTARWQPFDGTVARLRGYRVIRNSASLEGQNIELTGVALSVEQRLFQKLTLGLSGGYELADYEAVREGVESGREDDYFFAKASIACPIKDYGKVELSWLLRENDSNQTLDDFSNTQVELAATFNF